MTRTVVASLLFGAVMIVAARAQPDTPPPAPAKKKAASPLDALIGAALANDADVKLARAKIQLAEAEGSRARQLVVQKVVSMDSAIREQRKAVATAQQIFEITNQQHKAATVSLHDMLLAREKLETAQAKLASLETDLKLLTDQEKRETPHVDWSMGLKLDDLGHYPQARVLIDRGKSSPFVKAAGPIPARIWAALDKPIKLGPKDSKITFEQALEAFKKDAQLDVPIRNEFRITPVISLGEELPVGAWLQLFADSNPDLRLVVREYGLLVCKKELAPPDAISVSDFWKQKPEKKP